MSESRKILKNKLNDYSSYVIDYVQWVVEYDDCIVYVELYGGLKYWLAGEEYECHLGYQMLNKSTYNIEDYSVEKKTATNNSEF